MKILSITQLEVIRGGAELSNKDCSTLGLLAFGASALQLWVYTSSFTRMAIAGGCFEKW